MLFAGSDDGQIVFFAQVITEMPDVVIAPFAVIIFFVVDVVCSTENEVIVNVSFINMCADNIGILTL